MEEVGRCWSKGTNFQFVRWIVSGSLIYRKMTIVNTELYTWSLCILYTNKIHFILYTKCTLHCILYTLRRRQWHPTPVLLPGKSHGRRSLVGYSPWGLEELDTTEPLHFHFSLSCIGEGNGNPLQCSCLEIPGTGSLVRCGQWDRTESDMTKAT